MSGPRALEDDPVSFQDKTLTCKDCGQEFIWTAGEQEFYASRGLQNAPTRCPADRAARRAQGGGRGDRYAPSEQIDRVSCVTLNQPCTVSSPCDNETVRR